MLNLLITHLQIFGIGFSLGIAGPCLIICAPVICAYTAASHKNWRQSASNIFVFLSGRLFAYLILGYLAGLSGTALRHFTDSNLSVFFKPLSGVVTIIFGVALLLHKKETDCCRKEFSESAYCFGSLFLLGFSIGMAPCAPLIAILFNIAMMSKSALDGLAYAFSFGMGTLFSGMIAISVLTGFVRWIPSSLVRSERSNLIFRIICAALLIILGIRLMI